MKRIVECDEKAGLESLLGEEVLLMCGNYFYAGKLIGVNDDFVLLENPKIIYETGTWTDINYKDAQPMHTKQWHVRIAAIESYGVGK